MTDTIDRDSDAYRLEQHRKASSAIGGARMNPAEFGWVHIDRIDTDMDLRTRLVDLGWRPPAKPVDQPQCPTVAWQHPARADLVTSDRHAYTGLSAGQPRALVLEDDVVDHIDWLEHGIDEWRAYAVEAGRLLKIARDELAALKKIS